VGAGVRAGVEIGVGAGATRATGRPLVAANQVAPAPVIKAAANAASANRLIFGELSLRAIRGSSVFEEPVSSRAELMHRLISGRHGPILDEMFHAI
jgi:hypothetical protein